MSSSGPKVLKQASGEVPDEERGEDSSVVSSDVDTKKKPASKIPSASSRGTSARGRGRAGGRGRGRGRAKNKPQPVPNLIPKKKRQAEDEDKQDEEPMMKKPASKKSKKTPTEDSKSFELNS